jgi:hypothetical protein
MDLEISSRRRGRGVGCGTVGIRTGEGPADHRVAGLALGFGDGLEREGSADDLLGRPAEDALRAPVPEQEPALGVEGHRRKGR